jgi:hypothetical protein
VLEIISCSQNPKMPESAPKNAPKINPENIILGLQPPSLNFLLTSNSTKLEDKDKSVATEKITLPEPDHNSAQTIAIAIPESCVIVAPACASIIGAATDLARVKITAKTPSSEARNP